MLTELERAEDVQAKRLRYADRRPAAPRAKVRRSTACGVCAGPPAPSIGQSEPAHPALCLPISSSMLPPLHGLSTLTRASGVLQGWLRVWQVARRVLLFISGTSLMDVAAVLGCPPFHPALLFVLCVCHWLAAACIILACSGRLAADSWSMLGLVGGMVPWGHRQRHQRQPSTACSRTLPPAAGHV